MGNNRLRNLVVVLGDQMDRDSAVFDGFDDRHDAVWMAEVDEEITYVWSHKQRIAFFLSAMRHFRDELREKGRTVLYHELTPEKSTDRGAAFGEILRKDVHKHRPERICMVRPGDYRVLQQIGEQAEALELPLDLRKDRHFFLSTEEFAAYAEEHKSLVQETFYRHMRRKTGVLMADAGNPLGGRWNFDQDNRQSFGSSGPEKVKAPRSFRWDKVTRDTARLVQKRFADHPGTLETFDLPTTRSQALALLRDFVEHRLSGFGPFQDAMWTGHAFHHHSRLSAPLNIKLIHPGEVLGKVLESYTAGHAPLNSVEGFVRQILGWREYIRGIYWREMPGYVQHNHLQADRSLPPLYWSGETDMHCLHQSMKSLIAYGYTHHIQRLMVLGLFALLFGVQPRSFHHWHMAMYNDAVDWVSLPNVLGMSQFADGGIVGTKPYCASGNYINRMSNFCGTCRYIPAKALGDDACPFTTLYWDFLARHEQRFRKNPRMGMQMKNLDRKASNEIKTIRKQAESLHRHWR